MRTRILTLGLGCGLVLVAQALVLAVAHAGVPRACVHPQADPFECREQTRRILYDVIPSARIEALREQDRLEERGNEQDRERNQLLRDIRRELQRQRY